MKTFEEENIHKKIKQDDDSNTRHILESSFNLDFEKMNKYSNLFEQPKQLEPEDFLDMNANQYFLDSLVPNQQPTYPDPACSSFLRPESDKNKE